jgi:hypothetical protein
VDGRGSVSPWTKTNPSVGNCWRSKAKGNRVVAFPIWLYCDDTSGNVSKKWNKHNSFLFTAAGLPRRYVHHEYNIHFLSTSNIAPPLEMLDGIVQQLQYVFLIKCCFRLSYQKFQYRRCQDQGIWAWDCELHELVLVIPSVLAMLGDNPMQSEIACHVGLMGKLFCRICKVKGKSEGSEEDDDNNEVEVEGHQSDAGSIGSAGSQNSTGRTHNRRKGKKFESMADMIKRVHNFMTVCCQTNQTLFIINTNNRYRIIAHL